MRRSGLAPSAKKLFVREKHGETNIRHIAILEEVAATICFLAGPHAGYINGEQLNVAGGLAI